MQGINTQANKYVVDIKLVFIFAKKSGSVFIKLYLGQVRLDTQNRYLLGSYTLLVG